MSSRLYARASSDELFFHHDIKFTFVIMKFNAHFIIRIDWHLTQRLLSLGWSVYTAFFLQLHFHRLDVFHLGSNFVWLKIGSSNRQIRKVCSFDIWISNSTINISFVDLVLSISRLVNGVFRGAVVVGRCCISICRKCAKPCSTDPQTHLDDITKIQPCHSTIL